MKKEEGEGEGIESVNDSAKWYTPRVKILKKLTETVAIPFIDAAVDLAIPDSDPRKPMFKAVWYSIKGGYGFLEDFMRQIGEHREEITTELLTSIEFK